MTLFSGPEHASYIGLCRELRLEHECEPGDIQWVDGDYVTVPHGRPTGQRWTGVRIEGISEPDDGRQRGVINVEIVWLPRLDQLLTMLEKAGWVYHLTSRRPGYAIWARLSSTGPIGRIEAATPEEAALRLYCAVTGREVKA